MGIIWHLWHLYISSYSHWHRSSAKLGGQAIIGFILPGGASVVLVVERSNTQYCLPSYFPLSKPASYIRPKRRSFSPELLPHYCWFFHEPGRGTPRQITTKYFNTADGQDLVRRLMKKKKKCTDHGLKEALGKFIVTFGLPRCKTLCKTSSGEAGYHSCQGLS